MANVKNLFSRVYRKKETRSVQLLGIMASPRINGNSDILLDKALSMAEKSGAKTEKIVINNLRFTGCQSCEEVKDNGACKIEDDFQRIYAAVFSADAIIISSPIFFGSVSAQLKTMIDRFQCRWRAKNITQAIPDKPLKPGAFICVQASSRKDFFENAKFIVRHFFATIGFEYRRELFCPGLDQKGIVADFPDFLDKAAMLAEDLIQDE